MTRGFTITELLIIIGIMLILSLASIPIYGNLQTMSQLNDETNIFIQTIRTTKSNSQAGLNNSRWGIQIDSNSYTLYQGNSYEERVADNDRIIEWSSPINVTPNLGGEDDINFSRDTGNPSVTGTIIVNHDTAGKKTISVNSRGKIEEQ